MTLEKAARVFLKKAFRFCSPEEVEWLKEKIKELENEHK